MATRSSFHIRVTKTTNASTVSYSCNGRYGQINVNTLHNYLPGQPLFTTTTEQAFWLAVLAAVTAAVTAGPPS